MLHCYLAQGCWIIHNDGCGMFITRSIIKTEIPQNSLSKIEEDFSFEEKKSIIRCYRAWNPTLIQWPNSLQEHPGI